MVLKTTILETTILKTAKEVFDLLTGRITYRPKIVTLHKFQ